MFSRWVEPRWARRFAAPYVHIVFGARQTGKSTLLRKLLPDAAVWLDFSDPGERAEYLRRPVRLIQRCRALPLSRRPASVVVDEAQNVPAVFDAVQHLFDSDKHRWRFVLCGCSARKLRVTGANLLPGRSIVHHLYPLVLAERPAPTTSRARLTGHSQRAHPDPDPTWRLAAYNRLADMSTDARLTTLEHAMTELALAQTRLTASLDRTNATVERTSANLDRLADEMRTFKDEMRAFKEESRADRKAARAQMDAFQVEMRAFKDEMSRNHVEMRERYGELSRSLGTLAEDIVAPSIPDVFKTVFGVEPTGQSVRSSFKHPEDPGQSQEFDVVAWGGGYFLVNETRKRARPEDISALLELLPKARQYFPQAQAMKVVGSLASFYLDPSLIRGAERQGLLVFGLGAGLLEILNSPGFRPREI